MGRTTIGVGLLGCGVVGSGVAEILQQRGAIIAERVGCPVEIRRVLVRDLNKRRTPAVAPALFTGDAEDVLGDDDIAIVVEAMGGEEPACTLLRRAIAGRKQVVTANKEVMAKHGPELLEQAVVSGVSVMYEASVGGGIPLIAPFKHDLCANRIGPIQAILNGTTNYILTRMAKDGVPFAEALRQAQVLGYAEPDPRNDVEGHDTAYKLAILCTLAYGTAVRPHNILVEGIDRLHPRDFEVARDLGYAIKLLALGRVVDGGIEARVHPTLVPLDHPLARVDGVFNAVLVEGDLVGPVLFYGRGAGPRPTGSALIADLVEVARNVYLGATDGFRLRLEGGPGIRPAHQAKTGYYLRMEVLDRFGVLAQLAGIFGQHEISIASVIQRRRDAERGSAELIIMTHAAPEAAMMRALQQFAAHPVVFQIGSFLRVQPSTED
ncbi:MAG: homoserine dehydrogenase [Chloroflexi bacterium]|nr:homoserine dehydrogenase [Chloroflexota bacterium]